MRIHFPCDICNMLSIKKLWKRAMSMRGRLGVRWHQAMAALWKPLPRGTSTGTVETDPGPTVIKYSPPASERKADRAERRYRKLNDKTKGAFGQRKATPHYSSMKRRDRE